MNKKQLFEKYSIDESHAEWDNQIDNWYSIEIYRVMHDGKLPLPDDKTTKWVVDFLDKAKGNPSFLMKLNDWGSYYLTAKRMVHCFSEEILKELKE